MASGCVGSGCGALVMPLHHECFWAPTCQAQGLHSHHLRPPWLITAPLNLTLYRISFHGVVLLQFSPISLSDTSMPSTLRVIIWLLCFPHLQCWSIVKSYWLCSIQNISENLPTIHSHSAFIGSCWINIMTLNSTLNFNLAFEYISGWLQISLSPTSKGSCNYKWSMSYSIDLEIEPPLKYMFPVSQHVEIKGKKPNRSKIVHASCTGNSRTTEIFIRVYSYFIVVTSGLQLICTFNHFSVWGFFLTITCILYLFPMVPSQAWNSFA